MNQIVYPVESRCTDELEVFVSNGFSKWEQMNIGIKTGFRKKPEPCFYADMDKVRIKCE